jgi:hypothetical protein
MPNFDIIRKSSPAKSFRVASIMGTYDLENNAILKSTKPNKKIIIGQYLENIII